MRRRQTRGFTLVEALASVALMGLIMFSLATVTGQWLPSWHRGFGRVQRLEILDVGLRRIVADLDAAMFITPNKDTKSLVFIGSASSVTLVRAASSPGIPTRLEFVSYAQIRDDRGLALIRARAPFRPLAPGKSLADQAHFVDPVALIRAPYVVSFAFAGGDGVWRDSWSDFRALPKAVRVQIRDADTGAISAASTATHPPVDTPVECVGKKSVAQCLGGADDQQPDDKPDPAAHPAGSDGNSAG